MLELIAHGWIMVHGRLSAATAFDLYQSHKSLGFVVLMLAAARLFARLARASPAPAATPQWERRLAALVQGAHPSPRLLAIARPRKQIRCPKQI